jgi:hypothetical protein
MSSELMVKFVADIRAAAKPYPPRVVWGGLVSALAGMVATASPDRSHAHAAAGMIADDIRKLLAGHHWSKREQ